MAGNDILTRAAADLASGFALLTRLPVPDHAPRGADSAWCWPVVGAVVGALAALGGAVATGLGFTPGVVAAVVLALTAALTGALHEDGLADTADGLFGGWSREKRLLIMKDSRIGSFGAMALVLVTLAKWSALSGIVAAGGLWSALIAAGALSRAPMAVLMALLPNAREGGLSHSVGRPSTPTALVAVAIGLGMALVAAGGAALPMLLYAALATLGLGMIARARIGGQTGDILGASQQLAELCTLAVLAASLR